MKSRPGLALSGDLLGHSTSQSGFHPSELFGASDDGGLYDPSDLTSMFTGRDGQTDAAEWSRASVGSTVGTILDKSVTGGASWDNYLDGLTDLAPALEDGNWVEFTSGSSTITWHGDGTVTLTGVGGVAQISLAGLATGSNRYASLTIDSTDAAALNDALCGIAVSNDWRLGNVGSGTYEFVTTGAGAAPYFNVADGHSVTFSNITLKNFEGNLLEAPSDAARPVLYDEIVDGTDVDMSGATELITNGTFDTDSDWTISDFGSPSPASTIAGGIAQTTYTDGSNFGRIGQQITAAAGWVLVSFDVAVTNSSLRIGTSLFEGSYYTGIVNVGHHDVLVYIGAADPWITVYASVAGTASFDNVSIKEVPASRARRWYMDFDGTDDAMECFNAMNASAIVMWGAQTLEADGSNYDVIYGNDGNATNNGLFFGYDTATKNTYFGLHGNDIEGTNNLAASFPSDPHAMIAMADGSYHSIYVNGEWDVNEADTAVVANSGSHGFKVNGIQTTYYVETNIYSFGYYEGTIDSEQVNDLSHWLAEKSGASGETRKFGIDDIFDTDTTGAWYDPSDLSSMKTSLAGAMNAGVGPASDPVSPGSTVGCILDKSQIGGQSFTDYAANHENELTGAVGVGTYWTNEGGGVYSVNQPGTGFNAVSIAWDSIATGDWVYIEATVELVSGKLAVFAATNGGDSISTFSTAGTYNLKYFMQIGHATPSAVNFRANNEATVGTVSSIRGFVIPGNHLVAPSDAARPLVRRTVVATAANIEPSTDLTAALMSDPTLWSTDNSRVSLTDDGFIRGEQINSGASANFYFQFDDLGQYGWVLAEVDWEAISGSGNLNKWDESSAYGNSYWYNSGQEKRRLLFELTEGDNLICSFVLGAGGVIDVKSLTVTPVDNLASRYYLDFDGVNDSMGNTFTALAASQPMSVCLASTQNAVTNGRLVNMADAATNNNGINLWNGSGNIQGASYDNGAIVAAINFVAVTTDVGVNFMQCATDNFENWHNGSSAGTDTSGNWGVTDTVDTLEIGAAINAGTPTLHGELDFYGFMWVDRIVTDDERTIIEGELNKKSGAY